MKKNFCLFVCFLLSTLIGNQQVNAEGQASFAVSPIFSEHQTDGVDTFYDIRWSPGETDSFGIDLTNYTDGEKTYVVSFNKARTNKNGVIDYSNPIPEKQEIPYKLTEMVSLEEEVKVPANSSKKIKGSITFPDKDFDGLLMAGIHVSEKIEANDGAAVSNVVAYNLPFVVRGNIDERPAPILELTSLAVEQFSSQVYSVDVMLDNQGPNLMKEVSFDAQVLDDKGKDILTQSSVLDVTPETDFVYPVKLPSDVKVGTYTLVLNVKHSEKNKWTFKEKFEITKENVEAIKEVSPKEPINWMMYGLIAGFAVLLLIIVFLLIKLKKN